MPLEIVDFCNQIKHDFDLNKVREVENGLTYESYVSETGISKQLENCLKKKFQEFTEHTKEIELDYQIFIRTTPAFAIEEKVMKTFVVYSDGTIWLHLIKDVEETNRVIRFISPNIKEAEEKDLKRLCGEGRLSRWSYIKRATEAKPEEFERKLKELIDSKHYLGAETRRMLGSFGVKYEEQRSLKLLSKPKGVSVQIAIKDLFCQKMDLLRTVEDIISL